MTYKRLYILLEGNDDERFFEVIIKPRLSSRYDLIHVWQYAQQPSRRTKNFLKAIKAMNSDYFYLRDINNHPCVTAGIESVKRRYEARIDVDYVLVVIKEIESWYLAGLNDKSCKELGFPIFNKTDNIDKEQFNKQIPKGYISRIDFMVEILKRFSVETAIQKNNSFAYFFNKFI